MTNNDEFVVIFAVMASKSFGALSMVCESNYRSSDIEYIYPFVCYGYLTNTYNVNNLLKTSFPLLFLFLYEEHV